MSNHKRWSPQDLRAIKQMAKREQGLNEMALKLGRSQTACRYKLMALGYECKTVWKKAN